MTEQIYPEDQSGDFLSDQPPLDDAGWVLIFANIH